MSRPALALLAALSLGLSACGATLSDPLAIQPMLERCKAQADRGERPLIARGIRAESLNLTGPTSGQ